jgi:hypothetical protein
MGPVESEPKRDVMGCPPGGKCHQARAHHLEGARCDLNAGSDGP